MWGGWSNEKETVRKDVANLFSVTGEEIVLIHNTTEGMNLIARSFDLQPGDEIILANHEHASGTIPWEVWQETKGVKLVRPELPILPKSIDESTTVYSKAITPKTKLISMCHIVNTNGMILPVKELKQSLWEKHGIDCRPMSSHGLNAPRLSFAIYSTKKDIDYLVNALETIAS